VDLRRDVRSSKFRPARGRQYAGDGSSDQAPTNELPITRKPAFAAPPKPLMFCRPLGSLINLAPPPGVANDPTHKIAGQDGGVSSSGSVNGPYRRLSRTDGQTMLKPANAPND